MLSDLIRALFAALVVGVLPGYFWAACLSRSLDYAERLVYSIALSMMLVPSVALAQSRLFGVGVTLPITVVSVLLVFAGGFAVYYRFGAPKDKEETIATPTATPLTLPTLVPLITAGGLMLAVALHIAPAVWTASVIALFALAAGVARLLETRRQEPEPTSQLVEVAAGLERSRVAKIARHALLPLVLLLVVFRAYSGPVLNDWPYLRGVDQFEHELMTNLTLSTGHYDFFMLYPPGFHFIMAEICRISGLDPFSVFPVLMPALLVLPALACYALARRLWGWEYGVAAAAFAGLVTNGSYMHFAEARYPNLITAHFLLVVAISALIIFYQFPSSRTGILFALLGSSVVLYHQVAGFTEAMLLALVSVFLLPYLLLCRRKTGLTLLWSFALLGFLSIIYAWNTYDVPRLVAGLVDGSKTGAGGDAAAMAFGTQSPLSFDHLLAMISQPALWLGLMGAILLLGDRSGTDTNRGVTYALARVTLLLWGLLLLIGSRTVMSGFPERFERDLAIPVALFAAFALVPILRSLIPRSPAKVFATSLAVLLIGTVLTIEVAHNLEVSSGPSSALGEPLVTHSAKVIMTPEVEEAGTWLKQHNTGGNILVSPFVDGIPSRAVLALGGYTALQSYDLPRLRLARDLPPSGAGPLWDATWMLRHPTGERTRTLLHEHDVRYIVLSKQAPVDGMDYRPYTKLPDLYKKTFENSKVVILAPRGT